VPRVEELQDAHLHAQVENVESDIAVTPLLDLPRDAHDLLHVRHRLTVAMLLLCRGLFLFSCH
jgi:hypothetical protein